MLTQISRLSTPDAVPPAGYYLQAGPVTALPEGWSYLESMEIPAWQVADMTSFLAREGGITLSEFLDAPIDFLMFAINGALERIQREKDAIEDARRRNGQ